MTDELKPVIGTHKRVPETGDTGLTVPALSPRLRLLTHAVRVSAGLAALGAIVISAYFFIGFAENDERTAHLLNAFVMCFGIGALVYGPAFYVTQKAHIVLKNGPRTGVSFGIFFLMLPWFIVGMYFQMLEGLWNTIGGIMIVLVFEFVWWGLALGKAARLTEP